MHILSWVLLTEALAWASCILAWPLFASWPDRAFGLSKATGVLTLVVLLWTSAWTGLIDFTRAAAWVVTGGLLTMSVLFAWRRRRELTVFFRTSPAAWLVPQAIWLLVLAVFLILRATSPDIVGTEKFMDLAFLNSAVRAAQVPPADPWLSGFAIHYYHFGYMTWATVARMAATPAAIAYNLALAFVPAAVAAAVYSLALRMTRHRRAALVSALGLVFLGTLAGTRQIGSVWSGYDTWAPTRVIPGTINEFPFFTFLWGDLHPHLLAMPNFVVFMGLAVVLLDERQNGVRSSIVAGLVGVSAGIAAATSSWDVVPLGVVFVAVQAIRASRTHLIDAGAAPRAPGRPARQARGGSLPGVSDRRATPRAGIPRGPNAGGTHEMDSGLDMRQLVVESVAAASVALAVALPATVAAGTTGVTTGLASTHSPLVPFLLVQGVWLLPAVLLCGHDLYSSTGTHRHSAGWALGAATVLAAGGGMLTGSFTVALLVAFVVCAWHAAWRSAQAFPWLLVASGGTMLLLAEIVFVDDVYGRELERMNSVFKFHLHACLLLGLAWGSGVLELWRAGRRNPRLLPLSGLVALAAAAAVVYPVGAVAERISAASVLTLDGGRYLERTRRGDAGLIAFLNRDVPGTPVVAEATGAPYSYSSRISANTGLPTIVGWANHQRVWRRDPAAAAEIARRVAAVRELYEGDAETAARIIDAYAVRYVVVGAFERQTYAAGDFAKFERLGRKVFDLEGTVLFDVGDPRFRS